jgi:hypothetical protein
VHCVETALGGSFDARLHEVAVFLGKAAVQALLGFQRPAALVGDATSKHSSGTPSRNADARFIISCRRNPVRVVLH